MGSEQAIGSSRAITSAQAIGWTRSMGSAKTVASHWVGGSRGVGIVDAVFADDGAAACDGAVASHWCGASHGGGDDHELGGRAMPKHKTGAGLCSKVLAVQTMAGLGSTSLRILSQACTSRLFEDNPSRARWHAISHPTLRRSFRKALRRVRPSLNPPRNRHSCQRLSSKSSPSICAARRARPRRPCLQTPPRHVQGRRSFLPRSAHVTPGRAPPMCAAS